MTRVQISSAFFLIVMLPLSVPAISCKQPSRAASPPQWDLLKPGDYLRDEYISVVCQTQSPLKAWQEMESRGNEALEQLAIDRSSNGVAISAGYNFHEGTGPFSPERDGTLRIDDAIYTVAIEKSQEFELSDGKSKMRFRYVGDSQRWADSAVIAGTYEDASGSKYVFDNNGHAHFPGNRTFDYKVGLDMIMTDYDYIYSDKLKSDWAVKFTPSGMALLYDVDENRNEPEGLISPRPRWRLRQLTRTPCR